MAQTLLNQKFTKKETKEQEELRGSDPKTVWTCKGGFLRHDVHVHIFQTDEGHNMELSDYEVDLNLDAV